LEAISRVANLKGPSGKSARWFAEYDASAAALADRHCRLFLADLVVILQGAAPAAANIDFGDDMADVFAKCGQSMQAACHILRDDALFKVLGACFLRP
jgi:hypothetical protein